MKPGSIVPCLALLLAAAPAALAQDAPAGITSNGPESNVSFSADARLSDGRLVLRIAAQNRSARPVTFGPASVRVTLADKPVALIPLARLVDDVRVAAGLPSEGGVTRDELTSQPAPPILTNNSGQKDVSGYTGSMGAAGGAPIAPRRSVRLKPEELAAVEAQVAGLKAAILTDRSVAPGEVAAGQLVTEKLKLRGRERAVKVTVTVGDDTHSFEFDAPKN
jgi:hypothetical protein